MQKKNWLTKTMAILGTVLVGLPVLAPLFFAVASLIDSGEFLFDFLMPAELGILVFIGAGLLLCAAIRLKFRIKLVAWTIGAMLILILGGQAVAMLTGLASGATDPTGLPYAVVLGSIFAFDLAVALLAIEGILLCKEAFRKN